MGDVDVGDVDAGQWPAFPFARDVYQREGISCVRARRARRARKARKARRHQARCEARGKRQEARREEKRKRGKSVWARIRDQQNGHNFRKKKESQPFGLIVASHVQIEKKKNNQEE